MAINISDSGSTIKVEITAPYTYLGTTVPKGIIYMNKGDFEVSNTDQSVIISDEKREFKFLFSDITIPSGGSAAAVAALIEAFQDSSAGGGASAANQTNGNQKTQINDGANVLNVNSDGSIDVNLAAGTQKAVVSSVVTVSGNVAAGFRSVSFETSEDFTGSINGVAREASEIYGFSDSDTIGAIAYVITTGSINIDKIV